MITIVDYGMGNHKSVANMLNFLSIDFEVAETPPPLAGITHLIIPGVGAFDAGMRLMKKSGWLETVKHLPSTVNILGICLGMHFLTNGSEEGKLPGIGLIDGFCKKFNEKNVKVPHVGWNNASVRGVNNLMSASQGNLDFYFSHSYFVVPTFENLIASETYYGENFASSISSGNTYGLQFHPEKSLKSGMNVLVNFANLPC